MYGFLRPLILSDGKITQAASTNVAWAVHTLANGLVNNMCVNGSVVNQVFKYEPINNKEFIQALSIMFVSTGTPDWNDFGNIASLTNGLLISIKSNSIVFDVCNIKNNAEIVNVFTSDKITMSGSGFLNSADIYLGVLKFEIPILLDKILGDYLQITIRDNLTSAGISLQSSTKIWWEI